MITIEGTLIRDAEARAGVDCSAWLYLLVDPGHGYPFEFRRQCTSSHRAIDLARELRRGAAVTVTSEGVARTITDHDIPRFVLRTEGGSVYAPNVSF